ncbi:MAG: hybrid sensor histidine kinase/response regulator [Phycisphaerales bacterium]
MSDLGGFSMFELFKAEAETNCAILNEGLLKLEADPSDLSAIEPLMRAAHSLKGAARIIGVDLAVRLAHAMEDRLVAVQKGDSSLDAVQIDHLLAGTDLLSKLGAIDESELPAFDEAHSGEVDALVAGLRGEAPDGAIAEGGPGSADAAAPSNDPARDEGTVADEPAPHGEESVPEASPEVAVPVAESRPSPPPPTSASPAPVKSAPASGAAGSAPRSSTGAGATPAAGSKTLRVNAENLDRMMRLAGEMMIESRRFAALRESTRRIKRDLEDLEDLVDTVERAGGRSSMNEGPPGRVGALSGGDAADTTEVRSRRSDDPLRRSIESGRRALLQHAADLETMFRRTEEVATSLYHEVLGSRMRPFADGTAGFPRMVRDLAKSLGKQVRFEIVGGTVPVDRDILAKLEAPLNHMIRNCVDHGVEMPDDRRAVGKEEAARVFVEARHHGGMLVVRVGDDGRGIDPERIRRKVVDRGLQTEAVAAGLTTAELLDFLFLPGFSTAGAVTEISGRGVGLDVVQTMVQETGGSLRVETDPGRGATFAMRLPITLSVIRAALVEIAGEPYAFPLSRLERVVKVPREEIRPIEGREQFELDGASVGLLQATAVLDLPVPKTRPEVSNIMVVGGTGRWFGLVVDRFLGEEDLVVRPLDPRFGRVPHIASAALLENGDPLLVVDTDDLVTSVEQMLGEGRLRGVRREVATARRRKRVLVVEDSITVREVERQLLLRLGYEVDVAVDGVDGWNTLQAGGYDLVVSDIDMPRMNGIDFVKTLRQDDRFGTIPVIIVSYKDREEDRLRGMEAGANAYLTKGSFHDESFATMVRDLIGAGTPEESDAT